MIKCLSCKQCCSQQKKKKKLRCSPFASWYSKGKQEKAGKDACHWAQHWVGTETPFQAGLSVPVFNSMLFSCMLVLWSLDLYLTSQCCFHWLSSGILQVSYKGFSAPLTTSVLVVSRLFILSFSIEIRLLRSDLKFLLSPKMLDCLPLPVVLKCYWNSDQSCVSLRRFTVVTATSKA